MTSRTEYYLATFVGWLIGLLIGLAIIFIYFSITEKNELMQRCTNHNGVLVKASNLSRICINKNAIVSIE